MWTEHRTNELIPQLLQERRKYGRRQRAYRHSAWRLQGQAADAIRHARHIQSIVRKPLPTLPSKP